jgi:prophage antirepressor-like protein
MAGIAKHAGESLKEKSPGVQARASGNEINYQEEIVMSDNSTNVIPFNFGKKLVRTMLIGNQPWFVATDVASALEYRDAFNMNRILDDDEKGTQIVSTLGGDQEMLVINESGLYSAILRSRKAAAKNFKKWVTAEVLPAIRKRGRYEDDESKMNTLIGQTIGTDGFHMLGAIVKGKVASLPAHAQRRATAKIWAQIHAAFGVRSAADIPAEQLSAARNFVAAYVVLEGEYLQAQKHTGGIHLDQFEASNLYMLMSRFMTMYQHKNSMLAASRALGSGPLMDFFDQLSDGHISFSALDKRREELYAAYKATGCEGGYMWRAVA